MTPEWIVFFGLCSFRFRCKTSFLRLLFLLQGLIRFFSHSLDFFATSAHSTTAAKHLQTRLSFSLSLLFSLSHSLTHPRQLVEPLPSKWKEPNQHPHHYYRHNQHQHNDHHTHTHTQSRSLLLSFEFKFVRTSQTWSELFLRHRLCTGFNRIIRHHHHHHHYRSS